MASSAPPFRGAATRQRLVAQALELFASRGYHATTTALLAERAGIAEGTIYRHFAGKDALYSAVCRGVWERAEAVITDVLATRLPTRERLAQAARRLIQEAERLPAAHRLQARPIEFEVLDEPARAARLRFRDAVTRLVAAGKQDGTVRSGGAELWAQLWLAVVWSACERVAGGEWTPEHPNVALAVDAAWEMISLREAREPSTSPPSAGPASGPTRPGGGDRPPGAG